VTAEVTAVAVDAAVATAGAAEPAEPVVGAALGVVGWVLAAGAGAADPAADVAAVVADPAAEVTAVAADVAVWAVGAAADVTAEVTGAAADVTDVTADVGQFDVGKLAACACRESPIRRARMPAARIAACTARRAMCRNLSWSTTSSRSVGTGLTQKCQDRRGLACHN
jgi:hypothetical protein